MAPPSEVEDSLSAASRAWLDSTTAESRKEKGQYLTPRPIADALIGKVELRPGMRVLDPGVGTGELLAAAARRQEGLDLFGWDSDKTVLAAAASLVPEATLEKRSALTAFDGEPFDLVIANPPYFQFRPGPALKERYAGVISGRANIFAFFFQAGLDVLRPGGRLAFIVPPSLNSGAYFEALREHITDVASIESLTVLEGTDLFEGANTAVQLLVLRKGELRVAMVPEGAEFLAENHVNVIRARPESQMEVDWEVLHGMLADPGAAERLRLLTGNTQISARELTHLLPLG